MQFDEMAFGLGPAKGKDTASTLGPWMVTTDEMLPVHPRRAAGRRSARCGSTASRGRPTATPPLAYYTWGEIVQRASKDSRIAPGRRNRQRHRRRRLGARGHPQGLRSGPLPGAGRRGGDGSGGYRLSAQHAGREECRRFVSIPAGEPHGGPRPRHAHRIPLRATAIG